MPGESDVACAARAIHFVRTALLLKSANDNKENKIQVKIEIDPHTLERAEERGATEEEIIDVIRSGVPIQAKHGRTGKAKVFSYNQRRGRQFYEQKRVEVIYVTNWIP